MDCYTVVYINLSLTPSNFSLKITVNADKVLRLSDEMQFLYTNCRISHLKVKFASFKSTPI